MEGERKRRRDGKALAIYLRGGAVLDSPDATLGAAGVRARDTLYARVVEADAGVRGAATLDDLVAYAATAKAPPHGKRSRSTRAAETGFAGTLLGGGAAPPRTDAEPIDVDADDASAEV